MKKEFTKSKINNENTEINENNSYISSLESTKEIHKNLHKPTKFQERLKIVVTPAGLQNLRIMKKDLINEKHAETLKSNFLSKEKSFEHSNLNYSNVLRVKSFYNMTKGKIFIL